MAPTPPNTASRLKVKYTGPLGSHVMTFHGDIGVSAADLAGDVADVIDLFGPLQYSGTAWESAEYSAEGASFSLPYVDWVPIIVSNPYGPDASASPSRFLQFGGRSAGTGVRVKLYLYETHFQTRQDMRWNAGESATVDAVITELNSVSSNIASIDGQNVSWYSYANVGENAYLTHKARS